MYITSANGPLPKLFKEFLKLKNGPVLELTVHCNFLQLNQGIIASIVYHEVLPLPCGARTPGLLITTPVP